MSSSIKTVKAGECNDVPNDHACAEDCTVMKDPDGEGPKPPEEVAGTKDCTCTTTLDYDLVILVDVDTDMLSTICVFNGTVESAPFNCEECVTPDVEVNELDEGEVKSE